MSIERVVALTPAGPMLGGLDWRPPSSGKHSTRALHEAKNHTDSTHYTLLESHGLIRYGLYKPRASEETHKLPKACLSAAACFANLVGDQAPNAALVLPVASGEERDEQKFLVVVLEDGVPHIDAVVNEMAVRDTIGSEERPMWAFNEMKYPNCQVVDFDWLAQGVAKSAKMLPIPVNPWPVVVLASLVGIAMVSWWGVQNARKAEEARLQAKLAAEADPLPKYIAALNAQAMHMGTRRQDVANTLHDIFDFQVNIPGWQLTAVDCVALSQQCVLNWARKGGTFQDIQLALPSQKLVPVKAQAGDVPSLDVASTVHPWPIQRDDLLKSTAGTGAAFPSFERAMADLSPLLQVWRTAGLEVEVKSAVLWPSVNGVPPEFKHPTAVRRGQINIGGVPGPFIREVIETAPRWVQWEGLRVELAEGEMRGRLKFKATGNYYVSSN